MEDNCDIILQSPGKDALRVGKELNTLLGGNVPFHIIAALITRFPSIIRNVPRNDAERFKKYVEHVGAIVLIQECKTN